MDDRIAPMQFQEAEGAGDWRVVGDGACARFVTASLAQAAGFMTAIGALSAIDDHPPDIDIRPGAVTVRLLTADDDYYGMSQRDIELARSISAVARDLRLDSDPNAVQSVLVIPGAPRIAEVMPFWQAVLGYERRADSPSEDLVDPGNRGPAFWFEQMEQPRPDGGGAIHIAVWVPHDQAESRVAAALAAGGRLVRDTFAPAWWTLADAAGNEADIATISHRG
jgi:4a-hydroxytetrahydrobiopterin dehydratase